MRPTYPAPTSESEGFSLVEVLVAVAITALLAGTAASVLYTSLRLEQSTVRLTSRNLAVESLYTAMWSGYETNSLVSASWVIEADEEDPETGRAMAWDRVTLRRASDTREKTALLLIGPPSGAEAR